MTATRFSVEKELRKMASGQPTKVDPRSVAIAALNYLLQLKRK